MIRFYGRQIVKNILREKKSHSLIILQFAVAFLVLNTVITIAYSINSDYNQMIKNGEARTYSFTAKNRDISESEDSFSLISWGKEKVVLNEYDSNPFSSETLEVLRKEIPDINFQSELKINIIHFSDSGSDYPIYYSSYYDSVKISPKYLDMLNIMNGNNTINPREFPHTIVENELISISGKVYPITIINDSDPKIYMPIEAYEPLYHPKDLTNIFLKIEISSTDLNYSNILGEIQEILYQENGDDYTYSIDNELVSFLKGSERVKQEVNAFSFIVMLVLIIVMIGLSSLFVLLVSKRKKKIAINLSLGAYKGHISLGLFVEMLVISMGGAMIGILTSITLLSREFKYVAVTIYPNIYVSLVLIGFALLIVIISIIPILRSIKKLTPMEILRTL